MTLVVEDFGGMSESMAFEKRAGGAVRYWQIEREGIRCRTSWGVVGGVLRGHSMTLDDEAEAERHFRRKVREKQREGYVEVESDAPEPEPEPDPLRDTRLLDLPHSLEGLQGHEPLDGWDRVYVKHQVLRDRSFWSYLVLTDDERRGLTFKVKEPVDDPARVEAFLDFIGPRREVAFDGRSHHKVPLEAPIGPFTHALFCSPRLSRQLNLGRTAWVFPIYDCEIGDADNETFVEARIEGRGSLPQSTWDRDPLPVTDLKYDLRSADGPFEGRGTRTELHRPKFKTGTLDQVAQLLAMLEVSTAESRVEVRNYRGEILPLAPADVTPSTLDNVSRFVHETSAPPGMIFAHGNKIGALSRDRTLRIRDVGGRGREPGLLGGLWQSGGQARCRPPWRAGVGMFGRVAAVLRSPALPDRAVRPAGVRQEYAARR